MTKKPGARYPLVICDQHDPTPQPAVVACVHVMRNATVVHYVPPSRTEMGEALCAACVGRWKPDDLRVICQLCFQRAASGSLN